MFKVPRDTSSTNNDTRWYIVREDGRPIDSTIASDGSVNYRYSIPSDFTIGRYNEQVFFDLGIAVTLVNPVPSATSPHDSTGNKFGYGIYDGFVQKGALLGSEMIYANPHTPWLSGVPDNDSYFMYNWIHSGTQFATGRFKKFVGLNTRYSISDVYLDEDYFRGMLEDGNSGEAKGEPLDRNQEFEKVVSGLWSPYALVSISPIHPGFNFTYYMADDAVIDNLVEQKLSNNPPRKLERALLKPEDNLALCYSDMSQLPSVRIVFTADTSKWTRCPVVEMCDDYTQAEGLARKFSARRHASVNKDGKTLQDLQNEGATIPDINDYNHPNYIAETGLGWFPGYAINTVTGERLNMMFGEDSRYIQYHGRDMLWNPVNTLTDGTQNYVMGGRHFIYVMNSGRLPFYDLRTATEPTVKLFTPSYDAGAWARKMLSSADRMMNVVNKDLKLNHGITHHVMGSFVPVRDSIAFLYSSAAWVNMPLIDTRYQFENPKDIPCDVTINIDVRHPYGNNLSFSGTTSAHANINNVNNDKPAYQFVINSSEVVLNDLATRSNARQDYVDSLLGAINVIPNPYYSYSHYETSSQLETKVRIVNLPTGVENGVKQGCVIRIYTVDGTLVRTLGPTPVNATTIDWDLHNQTGIPISGGMYLIHINVPGIGERVIKWFGTMRPVDLNSFQF